MSEPDGAHVLVEILRDERGVILVCSCMHWGYAGLDEEQAAELHRGHVREVEGDAAAR